MGVAKSLVTLSADGNATRTTWTVDVDMGANPIGHYVGLTMDGMLGKDFASGLAKLKNLVESMPNTDIAGFRAEPVQLTATPLLVVTETAPLDANLQGVRRRLWANCEIHGKEQVHQAGAPFQVDDPDDARQLQVRRRHPGGSRRCHDADPQFAWFKAMPARRSKRRMWAPMKACRRLTISFWPSPRRTATSQTGRCSLVRR